MRDYAVEFYDSKTKKSIPWGCKAENHGEARRIATEYAKDRGWEVYSVINVDVMLSCFASIDHCK